MSNPVLAALPESPRIGVIGLGYVGLPLAVAFGSVYPVVGFDLDVERVRQLRLGVDLTGELDESERARLGALSWSADAEELRECNVYIVAVPTPVNRHKAPDLSPLVAASETIGALLKPGDVVVYESTVYPGATEEICVPVLQRISGLQLHSGFHVGYSPERINPGDHARRLPDIVKVTSGSSAPVADFVDALYRSIIRAGTHCAPDIRTAEAAKAIENTQRDVNIALMNELAQIFHRLGMDTDAVLAAAATKWNFLRFKPGLVGGHCIGVDPYYLIHKAQEAGHHPALITNARRINDGMAGYVCARLLKRMALAQINALGAKVLLLGATFKENCPDLRNSQVRVILDELRSYRMQLDLIEPWADPEHCQSIMGIRPLDTVQAGHYDAVVVAVAHRQFREMSLATVRGWLRPGGIVFDIQHIFPANQVDERL